jgi:outer membrane protein assembly factor BamA
MKNFRTSTFVLLFGFAVFSAFAQTEKSEAAKPCSQDKAEKLELLKKAEDNQYNIRHIYIVGNTYTRYRTFREYMAEEFNEGYIFTRKNLDKSIKGINKLKTIKPITLDNVEVRLEKDEVRNLNVIDFDICVEQKRK